MRRSTTESWDARDIQRFFYADFAVGAYVQRSRVSPIFRGFRGPLICREHVTNAIDECIEDYLRESYSVLLYISTATSLFLFYAIFSRFHVFCPSMLQNKITSELRGIIKHSQHHFYPEPNHSVIIAVCRRESRPRKASRKTFLSSWGDFIFTIVF